MGLELNQLPVTTVAADEDILHLQTAGTFVDKHITKANLLKEVQAEVDTNTSDTSTNTTNISTNITDIDNDTKSIPHSGGGTLTAKRINNLHDSGTYILPEASTTEDRDTIVIALPDTFSAFTPLVQIGGADNIRDVDGLDTEVLFNGGGMSIILTSNGIDEWEL